MNALIALVVFILFTLAIIAYLSYQKKRSLRYVQLIGATGTVKSKLDPHGTVLLNGEMWPARSRDGRPAPRNSTVQVVGAQQHFLVVDLLDE